ncbi:MAG: hypothetical protein ACI3XT_06090 [Butyricicoccaceae bacterium]
MRFFSGEGEAKARPLIAPAAAPATDQTWETTEQTKIAISLFLSAMIILANQDEKEDHAYAGDPDHGAGQAV